MKCISIGILLFWTASIFLQSNYLYFVFELLHYKQTSCTLKHDVISLFPWVIFLLISFDKKIEDILRIQIKICQKYVRPSFFTISTSVVCRMNVLEYVYMFVWITQILSVQGRKSKGIDEKQSKEKLVWDLK